MWFGSLLLATGDRCDVGFCMEYVEEISVIWGFAACNWRQVWCGVLHGVRWRVKCDMGFCRTERGIVNRGVMWRFVVRGERHDAAFLVRNWRQMWCKQLGVICRLCCRKDKCDLEFYCVVFKTEVWYGVLLCEGYSWLERCSLQFWCIESRAEKVIWRFVLSYDSGVVWCFVAWRL